MSSENPILLFKDILHVRISDSKACSVETGPGVCRLTVSHGAFRNIGTAGYCSPALSAIEASDEEWIFFDWWTGAWADNTFRFQLRPLIQNNRQMNGALFDEALANGGKVAFASSDSGLACDYYGNIPSCMLIRRDVLHTLLQHTHSLFPYPVQKLSHAAKSAGVELTPCREPITKQTAQAHLMIPAHPGSLLRRKNHAKKKLLVITHELSWTGAPLVLAEACIAVLKPVYEIMVLSLKDGPAAQKYLDNGISVMTLPEAASTDSSLLYGLVQPYDAVIVNTIVPYAAIHVLNALEKPVLWWIHESELIYECLGEFLPQTLGAHIHVRCVSEYALGVLKKYRPDYNAQILIYGLRDSNPSKESRQHDPNRRFRFATVGSVVQIKGQDILAEAVALLSDEVRKQCEFLFVGKTEDAAILSAIQGAANKYPDSVNYLGPVPRDVLDDIYPDVDCIICPSRCDCMPTFVTEGMMYGKPAICSESTGMAPVLRRENAGIVYADNDPRKLAAAITDYVALSEDARCAYSHRARACFDNNFTQDVLRKNLLHMMDALTVPKADKE